MFWSRDTLTRLFIARGADINAYTTSWPGFEDHPTHHDDLRSPWRPDALSIACIAGDVGDADMVDLLLQHGADASAPSDKRDSSYHDPRRLSTPLQLAMYA